MKGTDAEVLAVVEKFAGALYREQDEDGQVVQHAEIPPSVDGVWVYIEPLVKHKMRKTALRRERKSTTQGWPSGARRTSQAVWGPPPRQPGPPSRLCAVLCTRNAPGDSSRHGRVLGDTKADFHTLTDEPRAWFFSVLLGAAWPRHQRGRVSCVNEHFHAHNRCGGICEETKQVAQSGRWPGRRSSGSRQDGYNVAPTPPATRCVQILRVSSGSPHI